MYEDNGIYKRSIDVNVPSHWKIVKFTSKKATKPCMQSFIFAFFCSFFFLCFPLGHYYLSIYIYTPHFYNFFCSTFFFFRYLYLVTIGSFDIHSKASFFVLKLFKWWYHIRNFLNRCLWKLYQFIIFLF